jgi:hypothetical protein
MANDGARIESVKWPLNPIGNNSIHGMSMEIF